MRAELATSLTEALGVTEGALVSLVGAGGKTSLMYGLGREAVAAGRAVLLTTTTKVLYPGAGESVVVVLGEETETTADEIRRCVARGGPVLAGRARLDAKIAGFSPGYIESLHRREPAWIVVAECDGAKGGSLKVPREFEPPVAESTDIYVVVIGADCIGGRLDSQQVFNPEAVASVVGARICDPVDRDVVVRSVVSTGTYLGRKPAPARCCVFINKVGVGAAADVSPDADRDRVTTSLEIGLELKSCDEIERVVFGSLERSPERGFLVLR